MKAMKPRIDRTPARQPLPATLESTVTVVIPCYNYGRFLREAVASVLSQTDVCVDVIVVDDASTDESVSIANQLAVEDERVRVLVNDSNRGAVDTFNRGLAEATGEYLVRLDADDLLTPGSLSRAVALMQRYPSVGLVYGHPQHFAGVELPRARVRAHSWRVWAGHDWLTSRSADGTNVITSPEAVMRRSVVDKVGGQRPLAHTHDMEMWLRIAAHADVGYVAGADQAWHREHPGSLSTQAEDPLVILAEIRDAFDVLFDGLGPGYEGEAELRALARRAVARESLTQALRNIDRGRISADTAALRDFAFACDPSVAQSRGWKRVVSMADNRAGRAGPMGLARGTLSRIQRRVLANVRLTRWRRTGVYERPYSRSFNRGRLS